MKSFLAKSKKILSATTAYLAPQIASLVIATQVHAQSEWTGVCVGGGSEDPSVKDVATIQGLECLIANVFSVAITLIGLAGFVMFIIGSFRWLASGGNSKQIETAKGSMTYAVVGLVTSLSAFIVIELLASFTGVTILRTFSIPTSN